MIDACPAIVQAAMDRFAALTGRHYRLFDSPAPRISPRDYMRNEARFRMVERRDPARFRSLAAKAERWAAQRWAIYQQLAGMTVPLVDETSGAGSGDAAAGQEG